jgi:hypothetical protein
LKPATNRIAAVLVVLLLAVGCSGGLGAHALKCNRNQYNRAADERPGTADEPGAPSLPGHSILPRVASVSANLTFTGSIGAAGELPSSGPNIVTLEGSLALEDSPTMT